MGGEGGGVVERINDDDIGLEAADGAAELRDLRGDVNEEELLDPGGQPWGVLDKRHQFGAVGGARALGGRDEIGSESETGGGALGRDVAGGQDGDLMAASGERLRGADVRIDVTFFGNEGEEDVHASKRANQVSRAAARKQRPVSRSVAGSGSFARLSGGR